jgi:hypothetical protein
VRCLSLSCPGISVLSKRKLLAAPADLSLRCRQKSSMSMAFLATWYQACGGPCQCAYLQSYLTFVVCSIPARRTRRSLTIVLYFLTPPIPPPPPPHPHLSFLVACFSFAAGPSQGKDSDRKTLVQETLAKFGGRIDAFVSNAAVIPPSLPPSFPPSLLPSLWARPLALWTIRNPKPEPPEPLKPETLHTVNPKPLNSPP